MTKLLTRKDALALGLARYFTGKPCPHGHVTERYTASKSCCECGDKSASFAKRKDKAKFIAKVKEWRSKNRDKVAGYQLAATRKNPGKRNQLTANYRSAKDLRMPEWLSEDDQWMITEAYELATLRTKMLGFPWHVDHIVPLRSRQASGLHVPWNLQVIPGTENVRKGNRLEQS